MIHCLFLPVNSCYISKNLNMLKRLSTGSPWEQVVAYSRAVRVDNIIEVSGTTAMDGDTLVGKGDVYRQASFIFGKIVASVESLGGSREHIVRTRMYTTVIDEWESIAKAHREFFSSVMPAATLVEVNRLVSNELLIEIEATAIVPNS